MQNFVFSPDGWVYAALTTRPKDKHIRLTEAQGLLVKWRGIPAGGLSRNLCGSTSRLMQLR